MSLETILWEFISNRTRTVIEFDIQLRLKKRPKYCICCGKPLTAQDILGSRGHHCKKCFQHLPQDEEQYLCDLQHPKNKKPYRICEYIPKPLENGEFCKLECTTEENL